MDAQDKDLRTPLLEAIINNHIEVAHYLIQNGASVYHVVSLGHTGPQRVIAGAGPFHVGTSLFVQEEDGYTGLHHAAKLGSLEIVTMLLETGQVDVNAQVKGSCQSPSEQRLNGEVSLSSLLKSGHFQDSGGWTPIIWAAEHKHVQVIRALLNRGADVTIVDKVRFVQKRTKKNTLQYHFSTDHTLPDAPCRS